MTDLWLPQSTCGEHCLPIATRRSLATVVLSAGRMFITALVLLAAAVSVPILATLPRHRLVNAQQRLAKAVLRTLGVKHRTCGRLPERHALLVANHVSWLDVLVIL